MRKMRFVLVPISLFTSLVTAQEYEIRLHRPVKAGQRYQSSVTAKEFVNMPMSANGQLITSNKEDFSVEYDATVVALEVHPNGKPSREKHVVQKLVFAEAGKRTMLLTNGTIVVSSRRDKQSWFEIGGQAVEPQVQKALAIVAAPGHEGVTDDDLFGTREPKKTGESWKINEALLAQESETQKFRMKEVHGTATLKEIVNDGRSDVLVIVAKIVAKPLLPLPRGLSLKEDGMIVDMSGKFPVDLSPDRLEETWEASMKVVAAGKPRPESPEIQLNMSAKKSNIARITLLE